MNNIYFKEKQDVKPIEIGKLIHKFLHPLLVFRGNSKNLVKVGELLQKTISPEMAVSSDTQKLGEELKAKLLGIKDSLGKIDKHAVKDKLEREWINDLDEKLTKMIKGLDYYLGTGASALMLEIEIRDTALWLLDELTNINSSGNSTLKSLVNRGLFEFIVGILFQHLIWAAKILEGEAQLLEREVEALRTHTGREKERKYLFKHGDIGKVMAESLKVLEPVLSEKNIKVEYKQTGTLTAEISKNALQGVISNLFQNVRKYAYSGEGRVLKIKAREMQPDNEVELSFQSYGTPIKKEEIENGNIWKFGYRGELAHTNALDGVGVGLADAKEVVEAHGGKITIKSVPSTNDGNPPQYNVPYLTTVTIRIPRKGIR